MLALLAAAAVSCGPVPRLVMDPGSAWPKSMQERGADLRTLRSNFASGFARACQDGVIPRTGPVDREGKPFDYLHVANNLNANTLMISRASPENGGGMWMEDAFVDPDGSVRIPDPEAFIYEFKCIMQPPSKEDIEKTGDCLYD